MTPPHTPAPSPGDDRGPRPIKVIRVIARLNVGGPARQATILHTGLRSCGYATVLVHGTVGPGETSLEDLLDPSDPGVVRIPELGPRIRPLDDCRALVRLVRLVFAERPDVVHTHTAKAGALGRAAAWLYNITRIGRPRCFVVHTFHGHVLEGYFGPLGSWAVRVSERVLARVTDRVVTISALQREAIAGRFRVAPRGRVTVIPLGLDLAPFLAIADATDPALRVSLGFPSDCVLVGCIGRLVPIKNLPLLIDALAIARHAAPALRLVVVGDGQERGGLVERARRAGLTGLVCFTGWRRDLAAVYAGLDAVALSSRNEGTPVALIESLAAGRPVVATAVGGVPDVVVHDRNGLLVPPDDPGALASALVRLATSAGERRRLGAAGRTDARRFEKAGLLDALSALYREGVRDTRAG